MPRKLYRLTDFERQLPVKDHAESYRSDFRRDLGRLVHSASFRRLQGKTQLFPGQESDFFRNRLTHSIEVAQIAKCLALKLNEEHNLGIDTDLVEFAALAHDIGHPPFGHSGEAELDDLIRSGNPDGFEGNAQSLRILARLERREHREADSYDIDGTTGSDGRVGLNLTARSLAAVLKYDRRLDRVQSSDPRKGYYSADANVVKWVKSKVADVPNLRTIECSIMDLADDIAYSTYDLEDAFKAGILKPISLLGPSAIVLEKISKSLSRSGPVVAVDNVQGMLNEVVIDWLFKGFASHDVGESLNTLSGEILIDDATDSAIEVLLGASAEAYRRSDRIARNGHARTEFTTSLVKQAIEGVVLNHDKNKPYLSTVHFNSDVGTRVELIKRFVFYSVTTSSMLRTVEARGRRIVRELFGILNDKSGKELLPGDYRKIYERQEAGSKGRVIVDFIAGMTDRYALELHSRLTSSNSDRSIFKP